MLINELETPQVLVDRHILFDNINHIQKIADSFSIKLRPHIKTHKCVKIYEFQAKAGAEGITVSKPQEAIPFILAGVTNVTMAYPVLQPSSLAKFLTICAEKNIIPRCCIDSSYSLQLLHKIANKTQCKVEVLIIINTGYNRSGIKGKDHRLILWAKEIMNMPNLEFSGILTHNGLTYNARNKKELRKLGKDENKRLIKAKKRLIKQGIDVPVISSGSTPGILGEHEFLTNITELRPGNYVFMDRTPLRLKLIKRREVAQTILATVIGENDQYLIIDAGKKVLSSDRRTSSEGFGLAYPLEFYLAKDYTLTIPKLSEEHGFMKKVKEINLAIGDKVRILPNHSCVVTNLAPHLILVDGDQVVEKLTLDAARTSHGLYEHLTSS